MRVIARPYGSAQAYILPGVTSVQIVDGSDDVDDSATITVPLEASGLGALMSDLNSELFFRDEQNVHIIGPFDVMGWDISSEFRVVKLFAKRDRRLFEKLLQVQFPEVIAALLSDRIFDLEPWASWVRAPSDERTGFLPTGLDRRGVVKSLSTVMGAPLYGNVELPNIRSVMGKYLLTAYLDDRTGASENYAAGVIDGLSWTTKYPVDANGRLYPGERRRTPVGTQTEDYKLSQPDQWNQPDKLPRRPVLNVRANPYDDEAEIHYPAALNTSVPRLYLPLTEVSLLGGGIALTRALYDQVMSSQTLDVTYVAAETQVSGLPYKPRDVIVIPRVAHYTAPTTWALRTVRTSWTPGKYEFRLSCYRVRDADAPQIT